jgi:ATP-binding cassette subfamily F protein uup
LEDPDFYARDPAAFRKVTAELERLRGDLSAAETRWLELSEMAGDAA